MRLHIYAAITLMALPVLRAFGQSEHLAPSLGFPVFISKPVHQISNEQLEISAMSATTTMPESHLRLQWDSAATSWDSLEWHLMQYYGTGELQKDSIMTYSAGWQNSTKRLHLQDTASRDTSILTFSWLAGTWEKESKQIYQYDSIGEITLSAEMDWTGSAWDTTAGYKMIFVYDGMGRVVSSMSAIWTLGAWENDAWHTYTYHSSGEIDTITTSVWADSTLSWDLRDRVSHVLDGSGVITETYYEQWDSIGWEYDHRIIDIVWHDFPERETDYYLVQMRNDTAWVDAERVNFTFDALGGYKAVYEVYDSLTGWSNSYRESVDLDLFGNEIFMEHADWDSAFWDVAYGTMHSLRYDGSGNILEDTTREYSDAYDMYLFTYVDIYSRYLLEVALDQQDPQWVAFPNPAGNLLQVRAPLISAWRLVSPVGQVMMRGEGTGEPGLLALDVTGLPDGLYFLTMGNGKEMNTLKVVVKH